MFGHSPSQLLLKRWKIILFVGGIFAVLVLGLSAVFPLDYRADAQILIIPRASYGVDSYTAIKSAERIGDNIAQVVKTGNFYDKVTALPQYAGQIDWSRFQNVSDRVVRKRWQKTVDASVVYGTGVLNISTYHRRPDQAKLLASAVTDALVAYGYEYVGGEVTIKVVNLPIATLLPARPNLVLNFLAGFVFGALLMGTVVVRKK